MSTPTAKAIEIAHDMAWKLAARLGAGLAVVESYDTDQCPLITVGPGTAGSKSAVIKFCGFMDGISTDSLGLTAGAWGPEIAQLCTEADPAGGAGADPLDRQTLLNILGELLARGCKAEWYESASGAAPTAAALIAGNLKASFWPNLKQTLRSAQ